MTWLRRARSWAPASEALAQGSVETSSTDSINSGLISPAAAGSRKSSIALTSSSISESRIISSSSMPSVNAGARKRCSTRRRSVTSRLAPTCNAPGHAGGASQLLNFARTPRAKDREMALGYDGKLYILAFDHRGSFQKKMFGIGGDPTEEETETIADAKKLIFEGMLEAVRRGAQPGATGVLVDEQFGSDIPEQARSNGLKLAMPVEKSGQEEFDFEYGDQFGAHIEKFNPDFSKVLVRLNPAGDPEMNER